MEKKIAVIVFLIIAISIAVHEKPRVDYCETICEDVVQCKLLHPDDCVLNCFKGHRTITLPKSCKELISTLNQTKYIW